MFGRSSDVRRALERWTRKGLVGPEVARSLAEEHGRHEARAGRRFAQVAVGATGGVVFLLAAGAFLAWSWPLLGPGGRTAALASGGVLLHSVGALAEPRPGLEPVGWVLQASGLGVLLIAFGHSQEAWADGSVGGMVVGVLALSVPAVLLPLAVRRRSPVMTAVDGALAYLFLFTFLERAADLELATILWILDGVVVASITTLAYRLLRPGSADWSGWEMGALLVSLYAGLVLVFFTAFEHLASDVAAFPVDAWLALLAALTLWGIHRAPERLRRDWHQTNLAVLVLLSIPMAFWTLLESMATPVGVTAAGVVAPGVAAVAYGMPRDGRSVVIAGCVSLIAASWYLGVEAGGGLGVVGALVFTGALMLWVSAHLGRS